MELTAALLVEIFGQRVLPIRRALDRLDSIR